MAALSHHLTRPLSVRDMFRVGIGPSSSHTVGPIRAAHDFAQQAAEWFARLPLADTSTAPFASASSDTQASITVDLMGSLAATGKGHATDVAVMLGLSGYAPDTVPAEGVDAIIQAISAECAVDVPGIGRVTLDPDRDIHFQPMTIMPFHVNSLRLTIHVPVRAAEGDTETHKFSRVYYSVGGGFVMEEKGDPLVSPQPEQLDDSTVEAARCESVPYAYSTAEDLVALANGYHMSISGVLQANEDAAYGREATDAYLDKIWTVMCQTMKAGCNTRGVLPGVLRLPRRAANLYDSLKRQTGVDALPTGSYPCSPMSLTGDPLAVMDWTNLYALAVNEENAAGHRIVTAPTNGASGIIPAVLGYYVSFVPGASREGVHRFLLTAAAIGGLIKTHASIAGAEVGCQGEVGSACTMAAAGLAEVLGGTPEQVENAAEIAMEHSLGATCDPIAGLVQIPCIERNAIAASKAISAARMALHGDGSHEVSLDDVIETMRVTGRDMASQYKETSEGGLAVTVNYAEC
ncbi:MAG: L-serine ammonia-lyase [Actinomycetaceae bacterium]|nr:L-serine ammonia-lyase [Actinomycetaceae bacterium]MDY6082400.1 L-serine ammonia-lyase [Actinomycetaceae bacterium]